MSNDNNSLFISFSFDIPAPSSSEKKRLARGFQEDSLTVFVHSTQETIATQLKQHAASQTAAYQSAMQLTVEFVKNAIDASATKLTINIHFDHAKNKTNVFFSDNGNGMKEELLGSYDAEEAMLKSSAKKIDKSETNVYGGAGYGNAMAAHYNKKYGNAAPERALVRCNHYNEDGSVAGALIILESSNKPSNKEIVTEGGEYLAEMQLDLMNDLLTRFNKTNVEANFSSFTLWLKNYRENKDPEKSLATEFIAFVAAEEASRKTEKKIEQRTQAQKEETNLRQEAAQEEAKERNELQSRFANVVGTKDILRPTVDTRSPTSESLRATPAGISSENSALIERNSSSQFVGTPQSTTKKKRPNLSPIFTTTSPPLAPNATLATDHSFSLPRLFSIPPKIQPLQNSAEGPKHESPTKK